MKHKHSSHANICIPNKNIITHKKHMLFFCHYQVQSEYILVIITFYQTAGNTSE